jgi:hypothetical protein
MTEYRLNQEYSTIFCCRELKRSAQQRKQGVFSSQPCPIWDIATIPLYYTRRRGDLSLRNLPPSLFEERLLGVTLAFNLFLGEQTRQSKTLDTGV